MNNFKIFFGSIGSWPYSIKEMKALKTSGMLMQQVQTELKEFSNNFFLDQTHIDTGFVYKSACSKNSFEIEGDFIITKEKNVAISILTADCLPVVLYDHVGKSIGIAHSGWKGSVQKIVQKTINALKENYETDPKNITASLGPAAKACCYEVSDNFENEVYKIFGPRAVDKNFINSIIKDDDKYFFDNTKFTIQELLKTGIEIKNINTEYNICTICNSNFGSFRKYGVESPLQLSSIILK